MSAIGAQLRDLGGLAAFDNLSSENEQRASSSVTARMD